MGFASCLLNDEVRVFGIVLHDSPSRCHTKRFVSSVGAEFNFLCFFSASSYTYHTTLMGNVFSVKQRHCSSSNATIVIGFVKVYAGVCED